VKIEKISCTQFAGIIDREVSFTDGINIIYGKNESGKSTLVNLISRTLFQDAKLHKTKNKDFLSLYFPSEQKGSTYSGDFVDGNITFSTERGQFKLSKEWRKEAKDSRCTLFTPQDTIYRDQKYINSLLKDELRYGEGVYSEMLFSSQTAADESLSTILDASKKTEGKQEILNVVSKVFSESDGITTEAIGAKIDEKIEKINGKHWDSEREKPQSHNGRWQKEKGEILEAYYAWEDAEQELEKISELESESDKASADYTEKEMALNDAEHALEKFQGCIAAIREQKTKEEQLKIKTDYLSELKDDLSEWHSTEKNLEIARSLKFEKAKSLYIQLSAYNREVEHCPSIEDIRSVEAAIYKEEADKAAAYYTECETALDEAESAKKKFEEYYAEENRKKREKKDKEEQLKTKIGDLSELKNDLSEWHSKNEKLERASTLQKEKEKREILDKYKEAKVLYEELNALRRVLEECSYPSDEEIKSVKAALRKKETFENKLCGMNLNAVINMLEGHTACVTSLRTGEKLDITNGNTIITEAVNITIPEVMEMQLTPANVNAEEINAQISEQKSIIESVFEKYHVNTPEELETLFQKAAESEKKLKETQFQFDLLMGSQTYEELLEKVNQINIEVRSKEDIEQDIFIVCGNQNVSEFITAAKTIIAGYGKRYVSISELELKIKNVQCEIDKIQDSLSQAQNIPPEYADITDLDAHLKRLQLDVELKRTQRDKALSEKASTSSKLKDYEDLLTSAPAKMKCVFEKYHVNTLEELNTLYRKAAQLKEKIEKIQSELSMLRGSQPHDEFEAMVNSISGEVRSKEEIEHNIFKLCGSSDVNEFIIAAQRAIEIYSKKYVGISKLESKIKDIEFEIAKINTSLSTVQNIPQEYADITDPEAHLKKLQDDVKSKYDQKERTAEAKSSASSRLETYEETLGYDPTEKVKTTKRELEEKKALLRHWQNIKKVYEEQKAMTDNNPLQDIGECFTHYLSMISGGNVVSEFQKPESLDMNIYSHNHLLDYEKLSEGTKETVSLAFRLAVLEHLFPNGGGVIVFDDPFANMDSERAAQSCELIKECAKKHQVIFLTCRDDYSNLSAANVIKIS